MAVSSCLTAGITVTCATSCCSGGVKKIWVAKKDDITLITRDATDAVSAITMNGPGVFYEIQFLDYSASFTENGSPVNNTVEVTQALSFILPCPTDTTRQRVQELLNCCCGTVVIFEDMGGTTWILGDNDDLTWGRVKVTEFERVTGTALADPNQFTVTLGSTAAKLSVEFLLGSAGVPV